MSLIRKLEKKRRLQEAKDIAHQMTYDANELLCRKMDGLWLYTLHEELGIGKKRGTRLYWAMIENYIKITAKFNGGLDDDDMEWYAMERKLLDCGIDLKELQAEADRRYPKGAKAEVRRDES